MTRLSAGGKPRKGRLDPPKPLPLRWVVIGALTAAAATAAYLVAGAVAAIMAGCAVATAAHQVID
jgi:hypothetical protein